jgi:hypothetical protein
MIRHARTAIRACAGADLPVQLVTGLASAPSPDQFTPVVSRPVWNKPRGGFWTSSWLGPERGSDWERWRMSESFGDGAVSAWLLTPSPESRLIVVDGLADFQALDAAYGSRFGPDDVLSGLDFEAMARDGWDAVWLTERGQEETRYTTPGLYGWDAESVLWLRWAFDGEPESVPVTWWEDRDDE